MNDIIKYDNNYFIRLAFCCTIFLIIGFMLYYNIKDDFQCNGDYVFFSKEYMNTYCNLSTEQKEKYLFNYNVYGFLITLILSLFLGYLLNELIYRLKICNLERNNLNYSGLVRNSFCS